MLVLQRILQSLNLLFRTTRQVGYGAILYLTPFPVRFSQQDGLVNFVFALDYVLSDIHDYIITPEKHISKYNQDIVNFLAGISDI